MGAITKMRAAELIATEFGIAREGKTIGSADKALCHPMRAMFADGLCEQCNRVRDRALAPLDQVVGGVTTGDPLDQSERQAMLDLYSTTEYLKGCARVADAILNHNLARYAQLHMRAAEVAAEDGDAGPSQWALQHLKPAGKPVVDVPKGSPGGRDVTGAGGVQVLVGITLGQIPPGATTAQIVDAQTVEED